MTWAPIAMPHVFVYKAAAREVAVGDLIRFSANDYGLGVVNGQIGRVEALDAANEQMTICTNADAVVALSTRQPLHLDHGYCSTVHAAQGQTCERILVDAEVSSAMANEALFYVAISRARSEVTIYTDDRELLPEAMSRGDIKHAALDLKVERAPEMSL